MTLRYFGYVYPNSFCNVIRMMKFLIKKNKMDFNSYIIDVLAISWIESKKYRWELHLSANFINFLLFIKVKFGKSSTLKDTEDGKELLNYKEPKVGLLLEITEKIIDALQKKDVSTFIDQMKASK
jgi:hypothetical protein